jgi:hypothetical protein
MQMQLRWCMAEVRLSMSESTFQSQTDRTVSVSTSSFSWLKTIGAEKSACNKAESGGGVLSLQMQHCP